MKTTKIITICLLITSLYSCKKRSFFGVNGKGSNVTETINMSGFSKIDLSLDANVYYTQDSIYKVEISAQGNIQKIIETYLQGDVLVIKTDKNIKQHNEIQITIHSPNIYGLYVSGSGRIDTQNPINTTSLDVNVSGSGDVSISSLNTQNFIAEVSGSGNINILNGLTTNELFQVDGSGNINAFGLKSDKSKVDISGSGNINLWAVQNLNVHVSGSGIVSYKGSPIVDSDVSGSGKIIHLN